MILCDSGPIFAAADRKDADHHACVELFTGLRQANRRLLVPQTVMPEVGYLLETKVGTFAEVAYLEAVASGSLEMVSLTKVDVARAAELVGRYDDLPLGTTDASVIALAERLGIDEIATLDHRHFRVVRPSHIDAFTLLPEVVSSAPPVRKYSARSHAETDSGQRRPTTSMMRLPRVRATFQRQPLESRIS